MANKRWKKECGTDNSYELIFEPYYEEEVIATLTVDKDGDWCCTSKLLRMDEDYLCEGNVCEHDAKLMVEEAIYEHYEDEMKSYQDLMDKFSEVEE